MVTVGGSGSASTENRADILPFPASSRATSGSTSTVTVPLAAGVMTTEKLFVDGVNPVTSPLPTVTSACSNPSTGSEKVIVTVNAPG